MGKAPAPFSGLLAQPIVRPSPLVAALIAHGYRDRPAAVEAISEVLATWVDREKCRKLLLLADRYGVDVTKQAGWALLCLRIAEEFIPGFSVVDERRGRGRPRRSDNFDLVQAVDKLCKEGMTIYRACQQLSRKRKSRWYNRSPDALANEYRRWLKKINVVQSDFFNACGTAAKGASNGRE